VLSGQLSDEHCESPARSTPCGALCPKTRSAYHFGGIDAHQMPPAPMLGAASGAGPTTPRDAFERFQKLQGEVSHLALNHSSCVCLCCTHFQNSRGFVRGTVVRIACLSNGCCDCSPGGDARLMIGCATGTCARRKRVIDAGAFRTARASRECQRGHWAQHEAACSSLQSALSGLHRA
jgi:hypothetical protein